MQSRRPRRPLALACALMLGWSLVPGGSRAQEGGVEVIRGTERSGAATPGGPSRTTEGGVEVIRGLDPDAYSLELKTERYSLPAGDRQALRSDVDRMIDVYRRVLGVTVPDDFGVHLEILGRTHDFERRLGGSAPVAGFYRHDTREAVVEGQEGADQTREVALHESSHAILKDRVPSVPPWLNEGLARYFQGLQVSGGWVLIPLRRHDEAQLEQLLEWKLTLSVETLVGLTRQEWNRLPGPRLQLAYLQAGSLVYYLMDDEETRVQLRAVLEAHRLEGATLGGSESVERHYPGGPGALEWDWRSWLGRDHGSHRY